MYEDVINERTCQFDQKFCVGNFDLNEASLLGRPVKIHDNTKR